MAHFLRRICSKVAATLCVYPFQQFGPYNGNSIRTFLPRCSICSSVSCVSDFSTELDSFKKQISSRKLADKLLARSPLKVFIVAGEPSGDLIGARLMAALRDATPCLDIQFEGVGGEAMQAEGMTPVFSSHDLTVMGLTELLSQLPWLYRRLLQATDAIVQFRPDAVVTIDSKGFNMRLIQRVRAAFAANEVLRRPAFVQYVAPSAWAFNDPVKRLEGLRGLVDCVLCLLPGEVSLLEQAKVPSVFVGHPVIEDCIDLGGYSNSAGWGTRLMSTTEENGAQWPLLAVLPGSRPQEVSRHLSIFRETVEILRETHPDLRCVIPMVNPLLEDVRLQVMTSWPTPVEVLPSEPCSLRYQVPGVES